MNVSALEEPGFCATVCSLYEGWKNLRPLFGSWGEWWEGVKSQLAIFCKQWGRDRARHLWGLVALWWSALQALWRRAQLDADISLQEMEEDMLSLKVGSAPGCDGLPLEVYRAFWAQIGPDLLEVFRESLAQGQLPMSMRTGQVTLLH